MVREGGRGAQKTRTVLKKVRNTALTFGL